jgi:sulfite exporter TauE/SafE
METTHYDPAVIQKCADKLYAKANSIIYTYTAIGAIIGYLGGTHLSASYTTRTTYGIVGAIVIGLLGFAIGSERAFIFKLQAQVALCQRKIEENTRK